MMIQSMRKEAGKFVKFGNSQVWDFGTYCMYACKF